MKKFYSLVIAVILVVSFLFTGCSNKSSQTGSNTTGTENAQNNAAAPKYKMVFIVKSMQSPFMLRMVEGAQRAAKDLNIDMQCIGPKTPFSTEEQIRLMEDAIAQGMNAIIIAPSDSKAIVPGIEKANEKGVIVATPNTKALGGNVLTWTGVQNYDVGYTLGTKLAEAMDGKGKVVLLEGIPGSSTSTERIDGYKDALGKHPGIEIIASQTANFNRAEGMQVMENLLQRFPQIDGIGSADKEMLLGANEAIKAAKRSGIKMVGFDVDNDILESIKNGEVIATGDQQEYSQIYLAVFACWAKLKGYGIPKEMSLPLAIVDKNNVDEYLKRFPAKK